MTDYSKISIAQFISYVMRDNPYEYSFFSYTFEPLSHSGTKEEFLPYGRQG